MANSLLLGNPAQAFNEGMQTGRQNRFNALAGQAVAASPDQRTALLGQAAQADPLKTVALSGALNQQDDTDEDRRQKTLVNMARFYTSAPEQARPNIRAQLAPALAKFGIDATSVSPEDFDKTAQAIVAAWTPLNATASGTREFEASAAAAGLKPGTPEYQQAAKVGLGLAPRAVTGAAKTGMITGADGRERPYVFDPATQQYSVYDGSTWSPLGQQDAARMAAGIGAVGGAGAPSSPQRPSTDQLMQQASQMANEGGPGKNQQAAQAWLYDQLDKYGYRPSTNSAGAAPVPPTNGGLGVGRPAEETAGAVQNAKNDADLAALPKKLQLEGDATVDTAGRKAAAEASVAADAKAKADFAQRKKDADDTLGLLDEAERILPRATGSKAGQAIDDIAAVGGKSTEGARATAQLQAIAGQITSKMPRMQGPQSDNDVRLYQQMAGDLANPDRPVETRMAALQVIRRLQEKYQDQQPAAAAASGAPAAPAPKAADQGGHAPVDDLLSKYGVR